MPMPPRPGSPRSAGNSKSLIRVWTLGQGVGFGRYPHSGALAKAAISWSRSIRRKPIAGAEGKGHLEGIMGHRAMRLRFLDLEPEEVFANARQGDQRCADFELLWHRALAAASATSIHFDGPGKFFITGRERAICQESVCLSQYLQEMVAMSPLQGSVFEVIPGDEELAILGRRRKRRARPAMKRLLSEVVSVPGANFG